MPSRIAFILAAAAAWASSSSANAQDLVAQLFPVTGEIRLVNKGVADIPFVFYSIDSESDALDSSPAVWNQ